jgi:adenine-specific DNA-methyltransferase
MMSLTCVICELGFNGERPANRRWNLMIRDILNANATTRANDRAMALLRECFPSCFHRDGTFDIERFREFLSDKVVVTGDGYELRFLGRNYARLLASMDTTTVVVPDEEHNAKPENALSENIYITGDNLDALHHLLKSYAGKVKCIYIDIILQRLIQINYPRSYCA